MAIAIVTERPFEVTARAAVIPATSPHHVRQPNPVRPIPRTDPVVSPGETGGRVGGFKPIPPDPGRRVGPGAGGGTQIAYGDPDAHVWNRHGQMGLVGSAGELVNIDRAFYLILFSGTGNPLSRDNLSKRLIFPVNPDQVSFPRSRGSQTYDILNGPQAMQAGQLQLKTYSWSSFFPAEFDEDYCLGRFLEKTPQQCIAWLDATMASKSPIRFICQPVANPSGAGVKPIDDMQCYVTSFTPSYRSGEPLDVYYDIEIAEHREAVIHRVGPAKASGQPKATWKFKNRTTRKGDTLVSIARLAYGRDHAAGWKWIEDYNRQLFNVVDGKYSRPVVLKGVDNKPNPGPNEALKVGQPVAIPKPRT